MLHGLGLKVMDDRGDLNSWASAQKFEHMRRNGELYASIGDLSRGAGRPLGLQRVVAERRARSSGSGAHAHGVPRRRQLAARYARTLLGRPRNDWTFDPTASSPDSMIWWSIDPATVITEHGSRTAHGEHLIAHYLGYGYYDDTLRGRGKRRWNTEPIGAVRASPSGASTHPRS